MKPISSDIYERVTCHSRYSTKYGCSPDHGIQPRRYALLTSGGALAVEYPAVRIITKRKQMKQTMDGWILIGR